MLGGFICLERYLILQTPSNYILANDFINVHSVINLEINPSTLRPEGRSLLRVDPERRFFTPPSKAGLGAAEWVNNYWSETRMIKAQPLVSRPETTDWLRANYVIIYVYALIFWRSVTHVGTAKIILHSEPPDFDGTHITET